MPSKRLANFYNSDIMKLDSCSLGVLHIVGYTSENILLALLVHCVSFSDHPSLVKCAVASVVLAVVVVIVCGSSQRIM